MTHELLTTEIRHEEDVVATRQRARQIAEMVRLSTHDQTGFATAVSELARNALRYAHGGTVTFSIRDGAATGGDSSPAVLACIADEGPGISDLRAILDGVRPRRQGAALITGGIVAAKRLVDSFNVETAAGAGTRITISKRLPRTAPGVTMQLAQAIADAIGRRGGADFEGPLAEVQEQNRELMHALIELRARQTEVERLNAELAETNRGVLALYAELDEKADTLRRASELKTRFLSDMTHELRTPLNAMISLSQLLLDRVDGELTGEQERQVLLINRSATSLNEMVSDLLDIARIEAGKSDLHVSKFAIDDLLMALRGMFRPLLPKGVALIFEEPTGVTDMVSDERKLAQILRNLISNALKFTERGEVRVRTVAAGEGDRVSFSVADTGIGIAPADLPRIFDDFTQIDGPIQRRLRGTGLGLPLTRKLARLLGGDVAVESQQHVGSTFTLTIPRCSPVTPSEVPSEGGERA